MSFSKFIGGLILGEDHSYLGELREVGIFNLSGADKR
jgi:hypothetical protein